MPQPPCCNDAATRPNEPIALSPFAYHEANPNPIVYSVGEPLFMAGWILLSLAIALPMA